MRAEIEAYCAHIGCDRMLVQGAGGNVSWKDGEVLWVKASGTWLADAASKPIFVPVALEEARTAPKPATLKLPGASLQLRPSIETMLHAMMPQAVVAHLHAVDILAHVVRENFEQRFMALTAPPSTWAAVAYKQPGVDLARAVADACSGQAQPDAIFLGNHGVLFGGNSVAEIEVLSSAWFEHLHINAATSPGGFEAISAGDAPAGMKQCPDPSLRVLATDPWLLTGLRKAWALYPDHVVFLGATPFVFASVEELNGHLRKREGIPIFAVVEGEAVYLREDFNQGALAMLRCYIDVLYRLETFDDVKLLSVKDIAKLMGWDAETYRLQMAR